MSLSRGLRVRVRSVLVAAALLLSGVVFLLQMGVTTSKLFAEDPDTPAPGNDNAHPGKELKNGKKLAASSKSTMKLEFGLANSLNRDHNKKELLNATYGTWPTPGGCDPCTEDCMQTLAPQMEAYPHVKVWGHAALQEQIDDLFRLWKKKGGFNLDMQVDVNSCAYKTRTRWNAHGLWLHVFERNVTVLRMMADGYRRAEHIKHYVRKVVANSHQPFRIPMVFYISVNDIPCNVAFPYFSFFGQRGVMGIVIPDDSFHNSVHGGSWSSTRELLLTNSTLTAVPFGAREHRLFFRGSPTHLMREHLRKELTESPETAAFADIRLAVVEKFKHTKVPLVDHARYQYLLAIRGKTASSRDKYLNLLGSAIVWAADDEPWFQFYHRLWRPYLNYIPMNERDSKCVVRMLNKSSSAPIAARIAERSRDVGTFLTQDVADNYFRNVLHKYAELQSFAVSPDPIQFMKNIRSYVKKKYRTELLMPDDQSPVKFYFDKWLSRRIKQMTSCRTNNTYNGVELPADSKYRCWYM